MSRFPEPVLRRLGFPTQPTFGALAVALCCALPVQAGEFGLGRPATPAEIAAWDIDIRPDGQGLPEGRGDVETGEELFTDKCAACHGDFGEGVDRWPVLAGGFDSLTSERPVKTVGSYWPYLSTVWDYVHRAMPFGEAQSLSDDEVYAITAYILYLNDLVDDEFELSHENFLGARLPNEANFFTDDRAQEPVVAEICMKDCKPPVEITMRARVLDVTPESGGASLEGDGQDSAQPEPVQVAAINDDLAKAGQKVWRKCKACHQVGDGAKNRVGPHLNALFGRVAGSLNGFKYSGAMTDAGTAGLSWDEETLSGFLEKPKKFLKGTKMSFAGLKKEADRASVIEYLRSHSM